MTGFAWVVLATALAVGGASSALAAGEAEAVTLEAWAAEATVLRPEVHVLMKNQSDEPQQFLFEFGVRGHDGQPRCHHAGGARESGSELETRLANLATWGARRSRAGMQDSLGVIPPRAWAHRSFLLGIVGGVLPCRVPYRMTIQKGGGEVRTTEGVIELPSRAIERGESGPGDLDFDYMVERDRSTRGTPLLVRILVRNLGAAHASVGVAGIRADCSSGEQPTVELQTSTLQGEESGPVQIAPGRAHVFVAGVHAPGEPEERDCTATAAIARFEAEGTKAIKTLSIPLQITGFFDSGAHGFR
jgi:hypothetical protein